MTGRQEKTIVALIRAPTLAAAAKDAGVGISTLRRWLREDPAFVTAYRAALDELLKDASAQSKKNLSTALGVLAQIMESGENSQARIAAAKATIEYSLRLNEAVDVVERLEKLERAIDGDGDDHEGH